MLEKQIETKLVRGVKAQGGKAYKFVSPGNTGVPDRLVVWPDGTIDFVELKTERGALSRMQLVQIDRLIELHCRVFVLYGAKEVEDYLDGLLERDDESG